MVNEMLHRLRVILQENLSSARRFWLWRLRRCRPWLSMPIKRLKRLPPPWIRMTGYNQQYENVQLSVLATQQMAGNRPTGSRRGSKRRPSFSTQAAERARIGEDIIQESPPKIVQLKETVDESPRWLKNWVCVPWKSEKIVDVMRGISRQTNLWH